MRIFLCKEIISIWREAENYYLETGDDIYKHEAKKYQDKQLLSDEEIEFVEDGCNSLGI